MAQTLTRVLVHVIFSTKNRRNLITPEIEPELFPYMAAISRNHEAPILAINGTANHVHSVVSLSKNIALAGLLEVVKKDSSKWIKKQSALFRDFHWQAGYGGFSIGESQLRTVKDYIARQKVKHRTLSYK
jgi:REP element-mobilizing transposase RayT